MYDLLRKYNSDIDAQRLPGHTPLVIVPFGYPAHGKTTLLASLCFLMDRLPQRLPGFTLQAADSYTRQHLPWLIENFRSRSLEDATATAAIPPLVCAAHNVPASGVPGTTQNRLLTFFDVAGEASRAGSQCQERLSEPLPYCHVPWLLFNLNASEAIDRLSSLLETYIHLMTSGMAPRGLEGQRVVIVFTCCDLIMDVLPALVTSYLSEDAEFGQNALESGAAREFDLTAYMAQAERISECLADFTQRQINDGHRLMALAKTHGIELKFCATSATGHLATHGRMHENPTPKRVLDPLLWSLYEQPDEAPSNAPINVMIHAESCKDLADRNILTPLLQELKKSYPLSIYYLGRTRVESLPSAADLNLTAPKQLYPGLIMPLLEQAAKNARNTIVITHCAVHDSDDAVRNPKFRDRIQWVVTNEEMCDEFDDAVFLSGPSEVQSTVRYVITKIHTT